MNMATAKRFFAWLGIGMPLLLLSCQSQRAITVSPSEFAELYRKPRYQLHHIDYEGVQSGYQYLTERTSERYSNTATIQQRYRTPDNAAIQHLVNRPQLPIQHDPALDVHLPPNPNH